MAYVNKEIPGSYPSAFPNGRSLLLSQPLLAFSFSLPPSLPSSLSLCFITKLVGISRCCLHTKSLLMTSFLSYRSWERVGQILLDHWVHLSPPSPVCKWGNWSAEVRGDLVEGGEIKGSGLPLAFQIFTAPRCPFISQERTSTGPACWTCGLGDLMLQLNWEVLRLNALLSDLRKISLLYGDW